MEALAEIAQKATPATHSSWPVSVCSLLRKPTMCVAALQTRLQTAPR